MTTINITLPDGTTGEYPYGTRVEELIHDLQQNENPIVAGLVNNELVSLSFKIEINAALEPVYLNSPYGVRIYRRSLSFLLAMAAQKAYPDKHLVIGHSVGASYHYYFEGLDHISKDDIILLKETMNDLVKKQLKIQRKVVSYQEALEYFKNQKLYATLDLLQYRNRSKIAVYSCLDYLTLSYEPLVQNTSLLSVFDLYLYDPGFLLRFPKTHNPLAMSQFEDNPLLSAIYTEYKAWGKILNVNSTGSLNKLCESRQIRPFIQVAEALHDKKIAQIGDNIFERKDEVKVVLIAGPSSSGKTTFTKKLAIQLRLLGFNPEIISLDDYYLPRDQIPLDEYGKYDLESLQALDIKLLNEHLLQLFVNREVEIPHFDFIAGQPKEQGRKLRLEKRSILLMEGIHGLNPELTPQIPKEKKYTIYISALTQLNLDDHNRISTTDNRLIRRMVRDHQYRGSNAINTLNMWPSVRRGEDRNIFPYQNMAESAFNSALDYELSVLKPYAEPLLRTIKPNHKVYNEALRLLSFLDNFSPIPGHHVPEPSILREFIGGSIFA